VELLYLPNDIRCVQIDGSERNDSRGILFRRVGNYSTMSVQFSLLSVLLSFVVIPAHATFPGKNGRIAFGRYNPSINGWQLYTASSDGTDVQPLTFVSSFLSDWRADGKRIAFDFSDSDGNEQIATINPDGSNMQQITFGPGIHEVPSWSPTGTQIAFDYSPLLPDDPNFTTSIFVMNSDGSNPHAVTTAGFDVEPRFSPMELESLSAVSASLPAMVSSRRRSLS